MANAIATNGTTKRSWVVDWANKSPAHVLNITNPAARERRVTLSTTEAKIKWIDSLDANDTVFTELGASADILCARLLKKGVDIRRIQTRILKDWRVERGLDKSDSFASLVEFATKHSNQFYTIPPTVAAILQLMCLVRHYEITQEMRKSEEHRLRAVATMEFYLLDEKPEVEDTTAPNLDAAALEAAIMGIFGMARVGVLNLLKGKPVPPTLRRKFIAQFSPKRLVKGIMDELTGRIYFPPLSRQLTGDK